MVAMTKDRVTRVQPAVDREDPVAANQTIFAGAMVFLNAAGFAVKGSTALGLKPRGIAVKQAVNGAVAGDERVRSQPGEVRVANSSAADAITRADIGASAFCVDDQTVAKTNGGNTRSVAGEIVNVDDVGVWIKFGL
ncbi:MAG: hypothetical protein DI568_16705 [Sphingomonas sp.]|nr:MAG: hypothetical protein DI568_16705 [Sphingomonas sp.]